jgi:PAS domain S-box-containing protein
MKVQNPTRLLRPILAILLPLVAFILQWMFWPSIQPYVWFLFYPAVFFSSWIGGLPGGLAATVISAPLVMYFFMPPQFSFAVEYPKSFISTGIFVTMGILFGYTQERVKKANRETVEALAATRSANDQLETRVRERTAELAQTNELMRASEEHYRLLIESAADYAIYLLDASGYVVSWNTGAERLKGYRADEVIGQSFLRFFTLEDQQDGKPQQLLADAESRGHVEGEGWRVRKDGSRFWANAVITALRNEDGSLYGFAKITHDITERKRAEEALQESQQLFYKIFHSSPTAIVLSRLSDGRFVDANESFLKLTGYALDEVIGLTSTEAGITADPKAREARLAALKQDGQLPGFEVEVIRKSGEVRNGLASVGTVSFKGEQFALSNFLDITERKRAEETLRESEKRFRSLFENMLNGFAYCQMLFEQERPSDFIYLEVNKAFETLTGLKNVSGKKVSEVIPGIRESDPGLFEIYGRVALTGIPETFETYVEALRMWFSISVYSPEKEYFVAVFDVITERKQAEAALQKAHAELEFKVQERTAALSQANALLQTMMDHLPDQIYFKDAQSRFIRNSRSQADLMGLSDPAEVVGKTDFDFFPHAQRSYEEEQALMRSGQPLIDIEEYVVWPDGRSTWVSTTKAPWRDKEGQIIGTFGISRDITERKRAEQAIRQLNADLQEKAAQLEAANNELEAFSYSVSHDLRAPLRGIDGWSLALLEDYHDALDEQGRQYLDRVRSETQRMGQLIDDMLQLSRVTRAEMRQEPVNLSALAQALAARLQEAEPERPVAFVIQAGLSALGDASLLEAALSNLLSNAFKFTGKTPQARIEFGQTELQGEHAFFVRDNGAGFDMAYAQRLFGAFQRLHKASDFPGTGIGLATVQRVIHRHGGRVWAESTVNQGATFYFTLEEPV